VSEPLDDRALLELCRAGNEDAARELFDRYVERLMGLARRRISQKLAGRVDAEDCVQSALRTFFHRAREGKFVVTERDDVAKLLMRITVHKTLRQVAFHQAEKRDAAAELRQGADAKKRWEELLAEEPTPDHAVAFLDQMETFFSQLRPQERQILEMRLGGFSNDEIAEKLGIYDRKIRRVFERIRSLAEAEGLAG
jgi:RNA polymerase sigma-70 factor (ECF subfamily)